VPSIKKDETFFDLLESQAKIAVRAADSFVRLVGSMNSSAAGTEELKSIEVEGDDATHRLQMKLAGTFIAPLDHEDISRLSHLLDDITDCIEAAAARIGMYKLTEARPDLPPIAKTLQEITSATADAVLELHHQFHKSSTLPGTLIRIHELENESDEQYRTALSTLFDEVADPIAVIKWKELYERIEHATDRCQTVADVVENMIVKYG